MWSVDDDELSIFAGHTRFISTSRSTPSDRSSPSAPLPGVNVATSIPLTASHVYSAPPPELIETVPSYGDSSIYMQPPQPSVRLSRSQQWHYEHQSEQYMSSSAHTSASTPYAPMTIPQYHVPASHVEGSPSTSRPPGYPLYGQPTPQFDPRDVGTRHRPPAQSITTAEPHHHYIPHTHQHPSRQHNGYSAPMYHPDSSLPYQQMQGDVGGSDLAELGITSRDSGLDQRWTSFIQESGYLDGTGGYRR
jgi:hypothetical protein